MANTKFDTFVREQRSKRDSPSFDPNKRIAQWRDDVQQLYSNVHVFLEAYITKGDIEERFDDIEISEDRLGTYTIPQLTLRIGTRSVIFKPIGALVIGAAGRVDLQGRAGNIMLVLVEKDAQKLRIIIVEGSGTSPVAADAPTIPLAWKIRTPPPAVAFLKLTQDSLMDAILEVSNG